MREGPALAGWALNVITSVLSERSWGGLTQAGGGTMTEAGGGVRARAEEAGRSQNLMGDLTRLCPGAAGSWHPDGSPVVLAELDC